MVQTCRQCFQCVVLLEVDNTDGLKVDAVHCRISALNLARHCFWLSTAVVRRWLRKSKALRHFTENALQSDKVFPRRRHRRHRHQFSIISLA
eukprot:SAG31_NODE_29431_length_395_cov_1.081081_1_plen_91_part_10